MASETLYVNCQELHNPQFTPRVVSTQSDAPPGCKSQSLEAASAPHVIPDYQSLQLEATIVVHAEPTASPAVSRAPQETVPESVPLSEEISQCQNVALQMASSIVSVVLPESEPSSTLLQQNTSECQSVDGPKISPVISRPTTEVLQDPVWQSENATEGPNIGSGEVDNSAPNAVVGKGPDMLEPVSNPKPGDSKYSDEDDVQFILSVARKRRKKRPRPNPLPANEGLDGCLPLGKDMTCGVSKDTGNATSNESQIKALYQPVSPLKNCDQMCFLPVPTIGHHAGQQAGSLLRYPNTTNQNPCQPLPEMQNSHDALHLTSTTQDSAVTSGLLSAAQSPEKQKTTKRKRNGDQDNVSTAAPQLLGYPNANSALLPAQTPVFPPHLLCPHDNCFTQRPPNALYPHGLYRPEASQHNLGFESQSFAFTPGPQTTAPVANMNSNHPASQNRQITGSNKPSLMPLSMTEDLRRMPSLYSVPQWQPHPSTQAATLQTPPANATNSGFRNPFVPMNVGFHGFPSSGAGPPKLQLPNQTPTGFVPLQPPVPQPHNPQHPPAPSPGSTTPNSHLRLAAAASQQPPPHPPNILVDIAQTCQNTFPFAAIAKRHNQPVQKVFDIFSAVIQIPLLQSATDARRTGNLGSTRMKEFRRLVKGVREVHGEEKGGRGKEKEGKGKKGEE